MFLRRNDIKHLRIPLSGIPVKTGIHWAIRTIKSSLRGRRSLTRQSRLATFIFLDCFVVILLAMTGTAFSATTIPFTINMSESVNVTGTPRIAVDVGGVTRYATYASGTGTSALTFNYDMVAGDVDLDGVTLSSPIDLNGGTLKDLNGNNAALTFTVPNTSNVKVNYPSLGMDFTNGTSGRYTLNGTAYTTLPSFLTATGGTFTRNSIGTYFDSTGTLQTATANTPRFDYDPSTLAAKGILIEDTRSNLIRRSSEFDNAVWTTQTASIIPNTTTSPSGATDADKLVEDTSLGNHHTRNAPTGSLSGTFTTSIYAKPAGRTNIILYMDEGSGISVSYNFNLSTQAITQVNLNAAWTAPSTKIESVGNGWYRCMLTASRAASAQVLARYAISNGSNYSGVGLPNYTGDGTSGLYIWGAQVEQGSFATSYIPTTTVAVTRQADIVTIPTGTWYNQSAGTFMNDVSWVSSSGTNYPMFFRVDDTTNNERWNAFYNQSGNSLGIDAYAGGIAQGSASVASATSGTAKIASAQTLNSTNFAFNGTLKTLDTAWTPPTVTRLRLDGGGTNNANRWFKTLKYYPTRASDTQLQLLTQ